MSSQQIMLISLTVNNNHQYIPKVNFIFEELDKNHTMRLAN